MEFTARQLAEILNATIEGDAGATVSRLAKIEEGTEGSLTFLANPQYTQFIYSTKASIIIVNRTFKAEMPVSGTLLRVDDAYSAFATLLELYNRAQSDRKGISPLAFIHPTATLGRNVYAGEFAYVGEGSVVGDDSKLYQGVYVGDRCRIGSHTTLFPGVKVYSMVEIGNGCNIHAGAVIGADGFGFAPQQGSEYRKVAQIGNVVIEDGVEIGANTTIDRATLGSTIIRKGVKLDNLIQVAHNVEIGENTVIAAQTGISGSTRIGKNCMIGGQVGIIGHLTIADDVRIAAQSGIGGSITTPGAVVQGSPAFDHGQYKKSYVHFRKLHKLYERITVLEQQLAERK